MISLIFFLLGSSLASFICCFGERRRLGLSQAGRSVCRHCGHSIALPYLLPVLGFFLARGRCRHCQTAIAWHLPLLEFLGGCSGLFLIHETLSVGHSLLCLIIGNLLLLLSLDDAATQTIRDGDLLVLALIMGTDSVFFGTHHWFSQCIGAGLVALPLFLIMCWRPQGLGSGDVIFMAICGFYLGAVHIANAFLIGICLALCYSLFLIFCKKATRHTAIPLIPFLAGGIWAVLLIFQPILIKL